MRKNGFTMIELIVALAIVAMILTIAAPRYFGSFDRAKEAVLREDLFVMRNAIDKFFSDRNRYPDSLDELVTEKYLRNIPTDPFTQSNRDWLLIPATDASLGAVADVKSSATSTAHDGSQYKDW